MYKNIISNMYVLQYCGYTVLYILENLNPELILIMALFQKIFNYYIK